ncbi:MAG: hypothetical protein IT572_10760 [Deltaproteobacteria bacterium]|nr:hypothetical protein [Deltaproteobacteria bacterium]
MKDNALRWAAHYEAAVPSKAETYAIAERQQRHGRRLVMGGFIIAVMGIVLYCLACFSVDVNQGIGVFFLKAPIRLVGPALGIIGLGTLLWLVGSFLYLRGAMNGNPDGSYH